MRLKSTSNRIKAAIAFFLIVTAVGSLVYTQFIIEKIREKERSSVELWARAMEYNSKPHYQDTRQQLDRIAQEISNNPALLESVKSRWIQSLRRAETDLANSSLDFVASELIIKNRFDIPSVVVDESSEILHHRNIDEHRLNEETVESFAALNEPILIEIGAEEMLQHQYIYYGDSGLIRTLRYFPYVQFGLLALFLGLGYLSLSSIKRTEQSNLWVGMAREAAHQLGTPLSSLYGWTALLQDQNNDPGTLHITHEIHSDLQRMQTVADRFNKIGSIPELKPTKVALIIRQVKEYLEKRMPQVGKHVELNMDIQSDRRIPMSPELFTWALENLLKNALDAIDKTCTEARVDIVAHEYNGHYVIDVSDTGKGIAKSIKNEIFDPGFSTKKRGWGLGLSLTRRIVEQYHGGRVFVHKSVPGKGTTIRMLLPLEHSKKKTKEIH
ncbi:HAMP domain-containing sensor histidine kinase [Balneolaceae bacterium ANBcel3]|nr:HAMP domain-containing sensor histidine kinase [Balneolaceae bacterium ANBcel3]